MSRLTRRGRIAGRADGARRADGLGDARSCGNCSLRRRSRVLSWRDTIQNKLGASFTDLIASGLTVSEIMQMLRDQLPDQQFRDLVLIGQRQSTPLCSSPARTRATRGLVAAMLAMETSTGAADAAFIR